MLQIYYLPPQTPQYKNYVARFISELMENYKEIDISFLVDKNNVICIDKSIKNNIVESTVIETLEDYKRSMSLILIENNFTRGIIFFTVTKLQIQINFVCSSQDGMGYGKILISALKTIADKLNMRILLDALPGLRPYYEKLGFKFEDNVRGIYTSLGYVGGRRKNSTYKFHRYFSKKRSNHKKRRATQHLRK